jgi:hypothetical protein
MKRKPDSLIDPILMLPSALRLALHPSSRRHSGVGAMKGTFPGLLFIMP